MIAPMKTLILILISAMAVVPPAGATDMSFQELMSGLRISTMQANVSADKVATTKIQSAQAASSAAVDLYNRDQVRRVWEEYGPNGQLVHGCYQVGLSDAAGNIHDSTNSSAQKAAAFVYTLSDDGSAPDSGIAGLVGGTTQKTSMPYAASELQRVERHRAKYCSVSEASVGYCTLQPNGMQSGDSDFSLLYAPGQTYGWDQTEASSDFIKTVAPVRPMPGTRCTNPTCRASVSARLAQETYMSMARYSLLRFVESRSTQASGVANGGAQ